MQGGGNLATLDVAIEGIRFAHTDPVIQHRPSCESLLLVRLGNKVLPLLFILWHHRAAFRKGFTRLLSQRTLKSRITREAGIKV